MAALSNILLISEIPIGVHTSAKQHSDYLSFSIGDFFPEWWKGILPEAIIIRAEAK
ncbi:MAG: hypothetical protein SVZ03_09440 [Spirochaetota bacterium]|nr:hypothetical protein [Spirochaetota bacterium]